MPSVPRVFALFLSVFYFFSQVVMGIVSGNQLMERTLNACFLVPSALRSNLPAIASIIPVCLAVPRRRNCKPSCVAQHSLPPP